MAPGGSPQQPAAPGKDPNTHMGNPIHKDLRETVLALEHAQYLVNSIHCDCLTDSHKELHTQIPLSTIWHSSLQLSSGCFNAEA